jgi:prevent-host-death family protein
MTEVTIHEAKTHLSRLIQDVLNGEEVIITRNHQPVAKLVPVAKAKRGRQLGRLQGKIEMTDDFDAPLEDFEEYMR